MIQSKNPIVRLAMLCDRSLLHTRSKTHDYRVVNSAARNASPEAYKAFVVKWQPKIRECWKTLVQFDLELPSDMQIGPQFDVAVRVIQHAKEFLQGEAMRLSK